MREQIIYTSIWVNHRRWNVRIKRVLVIIVVIAVAIISVTAFSISQALTHPPRVSIIKQGNQNDYLVKGVPYVAMNLTVNNVNLTLYLQLIRPGGNLPSNTPFLIEVNAFMTSSYNTSSSIMINVAVDHAYLNHTSLPTENNHISVINGTVYQTTYHSVSITQPITNLTQFSADITVSFYNDFGPYYYSVYTINRVI